MDYASRAAKNSLAGCFCAVFGDSAAAVRIHPWICFEKFRTKEKLQHLYDAGVFGGAGAFSDGKYNITNDFGGTLYEYVGKQKATELMKYVEIGRASCRERV